MLRAWIAAVALLVTTPTMSAPVEWKPVEVSKVWASGRGMVDDHVDIKGWLTLAGGDWATISDVSARSDGVRVDLKWMGDGDRERLFKRCQNYQPCPIELHAVVVEGGGGIHLEAY